MPWPMVRLRRWGDFRPNARYICVEEVHKSIGNGGSNIVLFSIVNEENLLPKLMNLDEELQLIDFTYPTARCASGRLVLAKCLVI